MADFSALPVQNGVGPYHFNRYRMVFAKPRGATKEMLARDFVTAFSHYFNNRFANVVFHTDRLFKDQPTLEFHGIIDVGSLDIARPHNDWVARIWMDANVGFTVQTLKRDFIVIGEDAAAAGGGAVGGGLAGAGVGAAVGAVGGPTSLPLAAGGAVIGGAAGAGTAVHWNRMHFLAGRRSWRLDTGAAFGIPGDVYVLETTAVERFSSNFFVAGDYALHLETLIPPIWSANLANFARMKPVTPVAQKPLPGWFVSKTEAVVNYYPKVVGTIEELKSLPEFRAAFPLYKNILPPELL